MESHTEIRDFLAFNVYFIILFYLAVILFLRLPVKAVLASLAGGLVMGLINIGADLLAYNAHWWEYTINGLIFHLPLPFYLTPVLIYGSLVYLLIWRFWRSNLHWFALILLIGAPLIGIVRDILGGLSKMSYAEWQNIPLASLATIVMWGAMFYAGFLMFQRLEPARSEIQADEPANKAV